MQICLLVLISILIAPSLLAAERKNCSSDDAKKISAELKSSVDAVSLIYKKNRGELTQADMDQLPGHLIPLHAPSQVQCLISHEDLMLSALRLAGMACGIDDYDANLGFVLELESAKFYSRALGKLEKPLSACLTKYVKLKKYEKAHGND